MIEAKVDNDARTAEVLIDGTAEQVIHDLAFVIAQVKVAMMQRDIPATVADRFIRLAAATGLETANMIVEKGWNDD
jgi:hypothetical protein